MTSSLVHSMHAPPSWRHIDLISDLHLQAGEPRTFEAWAHFMAHTPADAVFILGDLFEVWVGDDAVATDSFLQQCLRVLQASSQQRAVLFMHGNRDFLLGETLLNAHGVQLVPDPTCLHWLEQRYLLSHGDALCLDDVGYQAFRKSCRSDTWQREFLSKPLVERLSLAREMRDASQAAQARQTHYADPDTALSLRWLGECHARTLIHGHTHRPADHLLDASHRRVVLSDWCLDQPSERAQVLRIHQDGHLQRMTPDQACA